MPEDNDSPEQSDSAVTAPSTPPEPISEEQTTAVNEKETASDTEPVHSRRITTDGMDDMPVTDPSEEAPVSPHTEKPSVLDIDPSLSPAKRSFIEPTSPTADGDDRANPQTVREGISKKMTTGLSWLRSASRGKSVTSPPTNIPPLPSRRDTNASVSTMGSHLTAAEKGPSLQDRFQALRLEEEHKEAEDNDQTPSAESPLKSPSDTAPDENPASPGPTGTVKRRGRAGTILSSKLPPGTASGMVMGPSTEEDGEVNWDLWQNLVYEGPTAVARTSGEELSAAIQSGIPAPIRGVVWQVLADSKSEHLEAVYRNLLGKDDAISLQSPSLSRNQSTNQITPGEKESLASSASSVHSHSSTPATSTNAISPQPTTTEDTREDEDKTPQLPRLKSTDQTAVQKLEKQIRKDLGARTAYSKYIASQGLQDGLFGVCKAYALYDEAIGYAQGMNFIAMPLLFNMPEEEAFSLFARMMSKYDLRSMFTPEMTGLHLRLYQFERLLEDYEPALYCHLHRRGVTPMLYATPWFLTLFAYRFPLQLVQRIYDLILSEGLSAILRFGIVLMRKNAQTLLEMKDMGQLTTHLKEKLFDVYIDKSPSASSILDSGFFGLAGGVDKEVYHADALVRDACAIDINDKTLSQYQVEFEEKARTEKERETELENLRVSNSKLSAKLKSLEARVEQQDADHVGIASELIRTKVENEALADANESLKIQVEELRKVVESQPAEVEERLNAEMQRIMARNIEVQNSNRALEDSMQEMEQELVGTKLQYAQINAEHEGLKQKLSSIHQLLGSGLAPASS